MLYQDLFLAPRWFKVILWRLEIIHGTEFLTCWLHVVMFRQTHLSISGVDCLECELSNYTEEIALHCADTPLKSNGTVFGAGRGIVETEENFEHPFDVPALMHLER